MLGHCINHSTMNWMIVASGLLVIAATWFVLKRKNN
jgi:LPXTG-motif cell wall-anchored protein